jgi:hypothetical protein
MPPRRRTSKDTPAKLAARMRSWRVSLLRGRAQQQLGTVEAPDERAAEAAAAAHFGLNDEQRKDWRCGRSERPRQTGRAVR